MACNFSAVFGSTFEKMAFISCCPTLQRGDSPCAQTLGSPLILPSNSNPSFLCEEVELDGICPPSVVAGLEARVGPEDLLEGGRDAAVVADDVAQFPPPQVVQLWGAGGACTDDVCNGRGSPKSRCMYWAPPLWLVHGCENVAGKLRQRW